MQQVGIVGLGTVGGTLASAFEQAGVAVVGYDRYLGIRSVRELSGCEPVFVCVPTPLVAGGGGLDHREVWSAVRELSGTLPPGTTIAIRSTVVPGTSERMSARYPKMEFASVPEFLISAWPMESLSRADRIIVGTSSERVARTLSALLTKVSPGAPVLVVTPTEAELVKLCSNAMLAAKVTLANELAEVCARFDVSWDSVQAGVGLDRRIGPDHLAVTAERGFGGPCLPKDLDGLIASSREAGYEPTVLTNLAEFNRRIRKLVALAASDGHARSPKRVQAWRVTA